MVGREVVPHGRVFIELNADVQNLQWEYESHAPYGAIIDIKSHRLGYEPQVLLQSLSGGSSNSRRSGRRKHAEEQRWCVEAPRLRFDGCDRGSVTYDGPLGWRHRTPEIDI